MQTTAAAGRSVTAGDVRAARQRIRGFVQHTPAERSGWLSDMCGADVWLKLECWQRTRSFKVRGAFNALSLLSAAGRASGVVTASAGNHGQAVALAAHEHGVRATVFVPSDAPIIKQQRIRRLGAKLVTGAVDYDAAERLAQEFAEREGHAFIHAFSDAAVVAGQGTVALEVLEDVPAVVEVLVPVGGGGLAAGVGIAFADAASAVRVTGVQSSETRAMYEAFRAGAVVDVPVTPTLADGLAGCTNAQAYALARDVVHDIVLVEEAAITAAIAELYAQEGVVAEGAAAVTVAALMSGRVRPQGAAVIVVTGGNIDASRLSALLSKSAL
jgi:threonine dehydratase